MNKVMQYDAMTGEYKLIVEQEEPPIIEEPVEQLPTQEERIKILEEALDMILNEVTE